MAKPGKRFAIQTPELLLRYNFSATLPHTSETPGLTALELARRLLRVPRREDARVPRDGRPGGREAGEAEAELEDGPGEARERAGRCVWCWGGRGRHGEGWRAVGGGGRWWMGRWGDSWWGLWRWMGWVWWAALGGWVAGLVFVHCCGLGESA